MASITPGIPNRFDSPPPRPTDEHKVPAHAADGHPVTLTRDAGAREATAASPGSLLILNPSPPPHDVARMPDGRADLQQRVLYIKFLLLREIAALKGTSKPLYWAIASDPGLEDALDAARDYAEPHERLRAALAIAAKRQDPFAGSFGSTIYEDEARIETAAEAVATAAPALLDAHDRWQALVPAPILAHGGELLFSRTFLQAREAEMRALPPASWLHVGWPYYQSLSYAINLTGAARREANSCRPPVRADASVPSEPEPLTLHPPADSSPPESP